MRLSKTLLPTLKEIPAEAEIASHQFMLRAGLMRKLASGLYTYLPLGWRVIRKVEEIIREEMDRAGALELIMPQLHPLELWEQSGRAKVMGKEMMRLKDRNERTFVLGPTHEEIITTLVASEIRSYKQLPVNFYQIATKFRDEIRPRFGIMRAREFIMKDAYSFDADDAGVEKSYQLMYEAYSRIFKRCGLDTVPVEADTGAIGGSFSHEFMVPASVGEEQMARCVGCGYAANLERAESGLIVDEWKELASQDLSSKKYHEVSTPGQKTIEEVSKFLKIQPKQLIKTLIYEVDGKVIAALIRGDHELNETKFKRILGCETLTLASPDAIQKATNAPIGFSGPVGLSGMEIVADTAVMAMPLGATGANKLDTHLVDVIPGKDFTPTKIADIRTSRDGDPCAKCGETLQISYGIEVGHCFKLGTKYSKSFNATYLDEHGKEQIIIMGCYGIGVTRTAAAVIESHNDKDGIIFPYSVAPYHIYLLNASPMNQELTKVSDSLEVELQKEGFEVLYDDRNDRAGVKFKDADLIGLPIRITIGERNYTQGLIEVTPRSTKQSILVKKEELVSELNKLKNSLLLEVTPNA